LELKKIKRFLKKFISEQVKIGEVQGEKNFCPRAVSKIAKQICVNQRRDFAGKKFSHRPADTTNN